MITQHRNKVIHLKDNSTKTVRITPDCEDIRLLANQTIESLVDRNPGLLVYPQCLKDCDDDLKKQFILSEYETVDQNQQRDMHITTANLIGFIGTSSSDLSICSRFTGDNGLGQDYFLHYMLQRVLSVNLFNLNHSISTEDQAFDFLLLLFPTFLKDALTQGLYKEYVSFRHNDANVRGVIDISRHLNRNIPFNGFVAYNSREIRKALKKFSKFSSPRITYLRPDCKFQASGSNFQFSRGLSKRNHKKQGFLNSFPFIFVHHHPHDSAHV